MLDASSRPNDDTRKPYALSVISQFVKPPFLVLPPTTMFPHVVIANGDLGLCAVVHVDSIAMYDKDAGTWFGSSSTIDPERMAAQAALDLAAAARAPAERVTAIVWLSNGLSEEPTDDSICASPDPMLAAMIAQNAMQRRLVASDEPLNPWLAAYANAALGPKEPAKPSMRKLSQLIEKCLAATFKDSPAVMFGTEIPPHDLVQPRFLFPALLCCASEDWEITQTKEAQAGRARAPGFNVVLRSDPGALLGARVEDVTPGSNFIILAAVVALVSRYKFHHEYLLEDLLGQYGRYLLKHGLDATVIDSAEAVLNPQSSGDE